MSSMFWSVGITFSYALMIRFCVISTPPVRTYATLPSVERVCSSFWASKYTGLGWVVGRLAGCDVGSVLGGSISQVLATTGGGWGAPGAWGRSDSACLYMSVSLESWARRSP